MSTSYSCRSLLMPGYRLDRYELLCPIAEGGMASIWAARLLGAHGFQKLVAVKTILSKFAQDAAFQQMFLDEARVASRIEHINVGQILDLGEVGSTLYLAMEWIDGDSLLRVYRAAAKKGVEIPYGVVLRILADTCGGLHAAHELKDEEGRPLNVVHRDVSPQNILVSMAGIAKLIDFGIAKARNRLAKDTRSGILKGKIHYMAPEQALDLPIDRRVDVWAIGAVLYRMLAGKPPYEGGSPMATLRILCAGQPPEPLPPEVPAPVRDVVDRALSPSARSRISTAAELKDAIESAMKASGCETTTSEVAAFLEEHLRDEAEHRRQTIESALRAVSQRFPSDLATPIKLSTPMSMEVGPEDLTKDERGLGEASTSLESLSGRPRLLSASQVNAAPDSGRARFPSLDSVSLEVEDRPRAQGTRRAWRGALAAAFVGFGVLGLLGGRAYIALEDTGGHLAAHAAAAAHAVEPVPWLPSAGPRASASPPNPSASAAEPRRPEATQAPAPQGTATSCGVPRVRVRAAIGARTTKTGAGLGEDGF